MSLAAQAPAHPVAALAAFAESLVRGRRVAVLGPATLTLGDTLIERGARLVHVYDPDPGRAAEALARRSGDTRGPVIAELADDLGVRDGAFDVVFVPDVTLLGEMGALVRRVRRLVSPSGVAVFASPNPEAEQFLMPPSPGIEQALGYYELYDEVSLQFPEVRMLGQAPFVGYAIVDFSEPDPDVAVDTSALEEPEAPEWYVAIASDRRVDTGAYSIIEVALSDVSRADAFEPVTIPPGDATGPKAQAVPALDREERERDILALTEAKTRLAVVTTENEKLREQLGEAGRFERQLSQASMRTVELERDLGDARGRLSELEAVAHRAETRAEAAEGEVLRLRVELEAAREEPATPRREALAQNERLEAARVKQELEAAQAKIRDLERQVVALEPPTLRSKEEQAQRLAEQKARAEAAEAATRTLEAKLAGVESKLVAAQTKLSGAESKLGAAESTLGAAEAKLAAAVAERDAAIAELEQLKAAPPAAEAFEQAHAADIAGLEEQLRERGREIARLQREMREGERVGKELLLELEDLRAIPPHFGTGGSNGSASFGTPGSPVGGAGIGPSTAAAAEADAAAVARAQEAAERAARVEADLVAASWRITQLERELAQTTAAPSEPGARERELERALVLAQREIAELRGAGRSVGAGTSLQP